MLDYACDSRLSKDSGDSESDSILDGSDLIATDNGASVVEGAVGGLTSTQFARKAFTYADDHGVTLTLVSSDINSANHNYPTNYNEAIYVAGSLPDTAPNDTCSGPGGLPGIGSLPGPPGASQDGCDQFLGLLDDNLGVAPSLQPTTTSFFRNSNLTQYGGKADVVLVGSTGSENTGQASGAAGLIASFGRQTFGEGKPLSGNEIRQLLTMTAEDVLPENTGTIGLLDKVNAGWDPHFGYGRVNLAGAMARIANERGPAPEKGTAPGDRFEWPCADSDATCVPPEAQIDAPDWYTPIDVDRVGAGGVEVDGLAAAGHAQGVGSWQLDYACGQDALDSAFKPVPGATGNGGGSGGNGGGSGGPCSTKIAGDDQNDRLAGGDPGERIVGRGGNDRISGGQGDDCIKAGDGNDAVHGDEGDDKASGNGGNDRVSGDAGNDRVRGGDGNDRLSGGKGNDRIQGKGGDDRITGGNGRDELKSGGGRDEVSGGRGSDTIQTIGGGRDRIRCGPGKDTVRAGRKDHVAKDCEKVSRG